MKIAFMGTPAFAVPSLELLCKNGFTPVVIVTTPDKPSGRGQKLNQCPVKEFAIANNIPVLEPFRLKDPEFLLQLKFYQADLFVIVAFRMLPEVVWNMPPLGSINLHGSLLPAYRGAAPINWAIIRGERITGITTFFLQHEIDTGDLLLQEEINILPEDDAGALHDKMSLQGAELLLKTLQGLASNNLQPFPQDESKVSHAPKLTKLNTRILPSNLTDEEAVNLVRGLSPYPSAWFKANNLTFKLFKARIAENKNNHQPAGTIESTKNQMFIKMKTGWIEVLEIQAEGKKRLPIDAFLRGFDVNKLTQIDEAP